MRGTTTTTSYNNNKRISHQSSPGAMETTGGPGLSRCMTAPPTSEPRLSRCMTAPATTDPNAAEERKLQTTTFRSRLRQSMFHGGRQSITRMSGLWGPGSHNDLNDMDLSGDLMTSDIDLGDTGSLAGSLTGRDDDDDDDLMEQQRDSMASWKVHVGVPNLGWLNPWNHDDTTKSSGNKNKSLQREEDEICAEAEEISVEESTTTSSSTTARDNRSDAIAEFIQARLDTFWSNIDVLTGGKGLKYHVELDVEPGDHSDTTSIVDGIMETSNSSNVSHLSNYYAEENKSRY